MKSLQTYVTEVFKYGYGYIKAPWSTAFEIVKIMKSATIHIKIVQGYYTVTVIPLFVKKLFYFIFRSLKLVLHFALFSEHLKFG